MIRPNIVFLDAKTLGDDLDISAANALGSVTAYASTAPDEVQARIKSANIAVVNKIKLNETNLADARELKLICVLATGYDNIDIRYCRSHGIAVCNVAGYSSVSVAQLSVSLALALVNRLSEYSEFVKSGAYTASGIANRLTPVYHEMSSLTWGVIGAGNIGKCVANTAAALGANVLMNRKDRTIQTPYPCVSVNELAESSDIISLHVPLTSETHHLISAELISKMKPSAIIVNTARGAVTDEYAVAAAIESGRLGGLGCDVYSAEPLPNDHPYSRIKHLPNVILTPHMAWGAYEARKRCLSETLENISAFLRGEARSRIV